MSTCHNHLDFVSQDNPTHVCKLIKAIYELKQVPWAWYQELRNFLLSFGFKNSHADASLFVFNTVGHILYLLVYLDDIILIGNSIIIVNHFVTALAERFSHKDLGLLTYFLGVEVSTTNMVCYSLNGDIF